MATIHLTVDGVTPDWEASAELTVSRPPLMVPKRHLVWVYNLEGVKSNVLD